MRGSRPIGFLQGRVVLNVPSAIAESTKDVDFRTMGNVHALHYSPDPARVGWAVRFLDDSNNVILAAAGHMASSTYTWRGNSLGVEGNYLATLDELPTWYREGLGNKHRPDNWKANEWFGHSGAIVIAPPDYLPQMTIIFVLHQAWYDGRTRTYYRVNSRIMENPEKYARAPNLERLHVWGCDRKGEGDPFARLPKNTPIRKLGEWDAEHFGQIDSWPIPDYYLDRMLHPKKVVRDAARENPVTKVEKYELPLHIALAYRE